MGGVHLNNSAIIAGETFEEPLSRKKVRVLGGCIKDTEVQPSAGGYQGLLDSRVLACEANVNDAVREYMEALKGKGISMGESITVVSAYTLYRHLQQYCFHLSILFVAPLALQENFSPLLYGKIFDLPKLKTFFDNKLHMDQIISNFSDRSKNIVGKGENADYKHFSIS